MSDSEAPKKDGALIRPATGPAQSGDVPAFFTAEALLRLEEGLRAQREQQEGRRFSEPDAASSRPEIRTEEPVLSPSWRRGRLGLLLCALPLIVGAAALGVSLKARTGGSIDAASVNVEARGRTPSVLPDKGEPRQPITNAVKSSVATQASSRWNFAPLDPRQSITNAVKSSAATPSLPQDNDELRQPTTNAKKSSAATDITAPSLPPDNHEPRQPTTNAGNFSAAPAMATRSLSPDNAEARQQTTNAGKSSAAPAMATLSLPPDNAEAQPTINAGKSSAATAMATPSLPPLPRRRPMNNQSKRKGPPHQPTTNGGRSSVATATPSLPRDHDEVGQLITKSVKSSAATQSLPPDGPKPSLIIALRELLPSLFSPVKSTVGEMQGQ